MQKYNLTDLVEFNNNRFNPKVLINEPGYRMVLISMLAGQLILEHAAPNKVTVYTIRGHISFFEGELPCELRAGEVVSIAAGAKHRVHAHEDSVLLVLATGAKTTDELPEELSEELDLREVPRPQRHPMIFAKFDALAPGASLRLLNDHDPIPLNRQFEMIRPGQAFWEYIERGPSLFRIRIRRWASPSAMDISLGMTSRQSQNEVKIGHSTTNSHVHAGKMRNAMATTATILPVFPEKNYLNSEYGLKSWLLTLDHKRIALLYLFSTSFFFIIGGTMAALIRLELLTPQGILCASDTYNKLFSIHGIIMVFFFLVPVAPAVLGNFLIPLMIGARDVAFPKINLLSWYLFVFGGCFELYMMIYGGVDTGWTFTTPLSTHYLNSNVSALRWAFLSLAFRPS